ncbi:hypothetical protein EV643_11044 [Kribbella sp. VKM Ac-2527]|uniref:Uncharacterized protein n=1 Tax=Kribbella caucasensis TaxID=2512215 RepID=A0A4R6KA14_9ACTN|nr:hypothetical protein [Kribbella sp. VKM Ac-2527]TDO46661.1 hypothetical protein EV643_11044 [Kribbella sp. VKM Ac-2527]
MTQRAMRDLALRTQHALSEDEIADYVARCPVEHRWAFGPYLRGQRDLAGDEIGNGVEPVVPSNQ